MVQNLPHWMAKLNDTFKQLQPVKLDLTLFWMSQCIACHSLPLLARGILYHVKDCSTKNHTCNSLNLPCVFTALNTVPSISTDLWCQLTGETEGSLRQSLATFSVVMTTRFALKWISTVLWWKGTICCMIPTPLKPEESNHTRKTKIAEKLSNTMHKMG